VAGHETTSTGTTWALFALTQRLDVQHKLRTELLTVHTNTPTMDELQSLQYLDAVVREVLRVHAPVIGTTRIAMHDEVIPVSEPYVDKNGDLRNEIR
jgi:cytochrome P450